MKKCIKCGSYVSNLHQDDIDQGSLCDVHYWQGRAHRAEAKQELKDPDYKTLAIQLQQQRTWVGLTDEEMNDIWSDQKRSGESITRAIEAKLKEKNT
jgi:hypothetical protein